MPGTVLGSRNTTATEALSSFTTASRGLGRGHSPNPGKEAAEEESAITLDERREKGEDAVD